MCGLAGFLDASAAAPAEEMSASIKRMTATLTHRGPDDNGIWLDAKAGLALGHRRLSILDLSAEGHQPMVSGCGRYVLVFNGEIYNFRQLRADLETRGHQFRGHSDTEVMLAAIGEWSLEPALQRFNGMFAFALWDKTDHTLYLARDRLGEKPLYYGWAGRTFLFGSEIKALRAHSAFRNEIDRGALALYLRHNYVPTPFSIFVGIAKLPAGSFLAVNRHNQPGALKPIRYWSLRAVVERGAAERIRGSEWEALDHLDTLLRDAVKLRMEADVPLGTFLSGGIDSSTVVALMQAQSQRPIQTFTIGFTIEAYDEARYAKAVAAHLGTDHTELYVTPSETLEVIPKLPTIYDEPFSDSSQIPMYLVARLARAKVTVSLSGDGGDELFGGYHRYFWGRTIWNGIKWLPTSLRIALARLITRPAPLTWDRTLGPLQRFSPKSIRQTLNGDRLHKLAEVLAVRDPQSMYQQLVSHWKRPASVVLGGTEPTTMLTDPRAWARLPDFTEHMMYLDTLMYLPDDILTKIDRASMAVSLEVRVPLLDPRVIEFAWRLPLALKIRGGKGKWLLRRVLERYLPSALINRPKMGFGIPLDQWLRGELRAWAEALLSERRLRAEGYFDPLPIRQKWQQHLSRQRNWQYYLWDILMFQAWLEHWTT